MADMLRAILRVTCLLWLFVWSTVARNSSFPSNTRYLRHFNSTRVLLPNNTPNIRLTMYNNIRGYLNWHEPWFDTYMRENCNYCSFSTIPNTARSADMVIFLASTFAKSNPRFPSKQPHQLFTLHTMEQPKYVPMMTNPSMLSKFDLVATYSQASTFPRSSVPNLPLSYYPLEVYDANRVMHAPPPFELKTGFDTGGFFNLQVRIVIL